MVPYLIKEYDWQDPARVFAPLAQKPFAQLLESAAKQTATTHASNRYSFIVTDPLETYTAKNGQTYHNGTPIKGHSFDVLAQRLRFWNGEAKAPPSPKSMPPFRAGAVGVFGYDLARQLEKLPPQQAPFAKDDHGLPDMAIGIYDSCLAFDHKKQRCFSCVKQFDTPIHGAPELLAKHEERQQFWHNHLEKCRGAPPLSLEKPAASDIKQEFTKQTYKAMVRHALNAIVHGEIFQVNVSQRFTTTLGKNFPPFHLYELLKRHAPEPFAAFSNFGTCFVASASPERFIHHRHGTATTFPIKGTRQRNSCPHQDTQLARELIASEKDRAENTMIVDLLRNDFSKVCQPNTVRVPFLCALQTFACVHHLVSCVEGVLRKEENPLSLLKACFPGGSITGAPKHRAMEIIAQLEPVTRGFYCGALGYIDFDGTMDSNILIRSFIGKGERVMFHAGGGIVADSNPQNEYEEMMIKARPFFATLGQKAPW